MNQVQWTAESGRNVSLELLTERTVNADGDLVNVPDWQIRLTIDGLPAFGSVKLTTVPEYDGLVMDAGLLGRQRIIVRVPEEHRIEVETLVTEYKAEINRRIDNDLTVAKEYEEGRERMRKVMGY
ncbi:MAG: hypothetical protein PHQ43_12895 [Dehalococcoidales bacterium]|nr:hypothetical protein [Dehalococcoidales bacterium]